MSYISRIEEEQKLQQSRRNQEKKSTRKMKSMVIAALVLSSASLVLSAFAATTVIQGKSAGYGSAAVVTPKYAGSAESPTIKEGQVSGEGVDTIQDPASEGESSSVPEASENSIPNDKEPPATIEKNDQGLPPSKTTESKGEEKPDKPAVKTDKATAKKVIYLTFDDGPSKYTNQIVDILNQNGIHATFFMIGRQLDGNEKAVKNAAENGNYVGLHSMTHDKKKLYQSGNSAKFIKEFKQEQALIKKITGTTPWLIRAPYGSKPEIGEKFRDDIAAAKFKMWDWTVDSKDWSYTGKPDRIIKEVKRQVHRDTEVILMHEKSQTVQALPEIISYLQKKGYSFAVYKPDQHFSVNFAKDQRL